MSLFSRLFLALFIVSSVIIQTNARSTHFAREEILGRTAELEPRTNAQRMAHGLGPLRPRHLFSSKTSAARRSVPSGTPGVTYTATIVLSNALTGAPMGYMGAYGVSQNAPSSTGSAADGWAYSYTVPSNPTDVVQLNHVGTPYRLSMVVIRGTASTTFGPGNGYYAELQNVRATTSANSAASTYVYDTYAIGYAQTTIFSVDPSSGVVTCKWVNPDGSKPTIYLAIAGTNLYATGDLAALAVQIGTIPTPVTMRVDV